MSLGGTGEAKAFPLLVLWVGAPRSRDRHPDIAQADTPYLHPPQQSFPSDEVLPPHRMLHLLGTDMELFHRMSRTVLVQKRSSF
jgi:hypothetical protein